MAPAARSAKLAGVLWSPDSANVWQVYSCAALAAFGTTLGVLVLLGELSLQTSRAELALWLVGAPGAVGFAVGLWLPRRLLARRSAPRDHTATDRDTAADEAELAASVSGLAALAVAVIWLILIGAAAGQETYRALLVERFMHPPSLTRFLLVAPAGLGVALAGAAGAVLAQALQGWHRVVRASSTSVAELWLMMLAAAALAGGIGALQVRTGVIALLALVSLLLAGIVAVMRKRISGESLVERAGPSHVPDRGALLTATAAGLALGAGPLLARSSGMLTAATIGRSAALVAGTAAAGVFLAHVSGRLHRPAFAPLLLIASAPIWVLRAELWGTPRAMPDFVLATLAASVAVAVLAGRTARSSGSVQRVLVRVGAATALGVAVALSALLAVPASAGVLTGCLLIAVATIGLAGLALLVDHGVALPARLTGLALGTAWLILIQARTAENRYSAAGLDTDRGRPALAAHADALFGEGVLRTRRLAATDLLPAGPGWQVDLAGPRWDVIVVSPRAAAGVPHAAERRFLRRCKRALLRGGRLVIELPNDELVAEALTLQVVPGGSPLRTTRARVLRLQESTLAEEPGAKTDGYSAVVFGDDVAAWLLQTPPPDGVTIELSPVPEHATSVGGQ